MSDLKNTLTGLAKNLGKASRDMLATSKLSIKLMNEESGLKQAYEEIGKKVHELYSYGGTLGKYFDDKYLELLEIESRINGLKTQINAAKGVKICQGCGKNVDKTADFCPKCGGSGFGTYSGSSAGNVDAPPAPIAVQQEPELINEVSPPEPKKVCPLCGYNKNNGDDKFCIGCGRMM